MPSIIARMIALVRRLLRYDFFRFLIVGGVNTLFSYVLYATLVLIGIEYHLSLTLMTVITIIWNFNTTGRFVFNRRDWRLFFKFLAVYAVVYLINLLVLTLLVRAGVGKLAGQALALPLMVVFSFSFMKLWVFRSPAGSGKSRPK